jgi:RNA polymerase sigma-70 factor (ECF subfamily)
MKVLAEDVVERARGGDEAAFRAIVETYSRDVFRLAFRITGNEEDAEDAVQETFLRAYQKLKGFESRSSLGTWLYRVTANSAIDVVRRNKRHENRRAPLEEDPPSQAAQEGAVFGSQLRDLLDSSLSGLSELERSAFALRHFQECTLAEVSEALGITVSAAKQALFRAVRKIRKTLAPLSRSTP